VKFQMTTTAAVNQPNKNKKLKFKVTEYIITDGPTGNQIVSGPEEIEAHDIKQVIELTKHLFSEEERHRWVIELPYFTLNDNPAKIYVGYIIKRDTRTGQLFSSFEPEAQILDEIDCDDRNTSGTSEWDFVRNYEHIFVIEPLEKENAGSFDWTKNNNDATSLLPFDNKDDIMSNLYVDIQDRNDCILHLTGPCMVR